MTPILTEVEEKKDTAISTPQSWTPRISFDENKQIWRVAGVKNQPKRFQLKVADTELSTITIEVKTGIIYHTAWSKGDKESTVGWIEAITETPELENYYVQGSLVNIEELLGIEYESHELEERALLDIYINFSNIEKVKSIYVQKYREELQIYSLLSITQHDRKLMQSLFDMEYDIRKKYSEIIFQFFYPPAGISEKEDFIHPQARCIFAR